MCHLLYAPLQLQGQETLQFSLGLDSRSNLGLTHLPLLREAKFSFVCALICSCPIVLTKEGEIAF